MTNSLEVSVSTYKDLVLVAKSSKECSSNHFWQVFSWLLILQYAKFLPLLSDPFVRIEGYKIVYFAQWLQGPKT